MRLFLLSIIVLTSVHSFARGVEAIQLDHVPVDIALKCDRIFFKSTQHFTGTIYALPRIIADTDEHYEDVVRLVKNPKQTPGKPFILGFKTYFPRDDEEIKSKSSFEVASQFKACNFELIKKYLNSVNPSTPIHTVASMPITSFEISFPDYISTSKMVGRTAESGAADILDYQGKSYNFTYEISDKESQALIEALQSGAGLQARVRFKFQARSRDGSLSVKIDTEKLAANFEAKASGKYGKIAKGDIEATLRLALDSTKVDINVQAGSAEFEAISSKIIDKVLSELNMTIKDVTPGGKETTENSSDEISIKVVADIIRSKVSQNVEFHNVKAAEEASAETVLQLDTGSLDPNITQIRVSAGEGDVTLIEPIYKGQVIKIAPAFHSLLTVEYTDKVSYLSVEQMGSSAYSTYFQQMLTSGRYNVKNYERNGYTVGVVTPTIMSKPFGYFATEYVWRRVERIPEIVRAPRVSMGSELADFDRFPVTVGFTNVGNQRTRFKFQDLLGENEYWSARYDKFSGTIVLTANKDLGLMVFKQRFLLNGKNNDSLAEDDDVNQPDFVRAQVVTEELIREDRTTFYEITDSVPQPIRTNNKATLKRRTVFFNITREDAVAPKGVSHEERSSFNDR